MPDFNNGVQISPGSYGGVLSDPNMTSAPSLPSIYNTNPSSPSAAPWANFRFQNPTSPFQQNFNSLAAQDPNAAFSYGFTGRGGPGAASNSNDLRHALDAAGYNSAGILGAYNRGGFDPTSGMGKSIGMPSDWNTPSGYLDRTGSSFNFNGNSYNLQNPEAAANTKVGYNGGGGNSAPGGSSWWDAVKQFQQTQGGPPAAGTGGNGPDYDNSANHDMVLRTNAQGQEVDATGRPIYSNGQGGYTYYPKNTGGSTPNQQQGHMGINNPVNTRMNTIPQYSGGGRPMPGSGPVTYGGGLGRVYNQQPVNTRMMPPSPAVQPPSGLSQPWAGHMTSGGR